VLSARNRFGRDRLSTPENVRVVSEIMGGIAGRRLRVEYVIGDAPEPADAGPDERAQAGPANPEDGVQRAGDIFEGEEVDPGDSSSRS